jgi:hypothetical protein
MSKFRVPDVYRKQPWYQARPEPEEEFEGTLESMQTVIGAANRPSLAFILRTEGDELLVYAAGFMDILEPLVGQPLRIRGKTVDFTGEGGTRELWIAMIIASGRGRIGLLCHHDAVREPLNGRTNPPLNSGWFNSVLK